MSPILRCSVCDERVRIPDVDSDTWVRCPFCNEEYQLNQVTKDLPPRLEVLQGPALILDGAPNREFASTAPKTDLDPPNLDAFESHESGLQLATSGPRVRQSVGVQSEAETPAAQVRTPPLHANRSKSETPRIIWGFFKIALGAVAGLAIGQLILWWLPEPYKSDPLDLASKIPTQAKFLLPPDMKLVDNDSSTVEVASDVTITDKTETNRGSSGNDVTSKRADSDTEKNVLHGQSVPATDLRYSLRTALAEDIAFNERTTEAQSKQKYCALWYDGMRQLGGCVTNIESLDVVSDGVVEDLLKFLVEVAGNRRKTALMSKFAVSQLTQDNPIERQGIALAGQVVEIQPAGEFYRTELVLVDNNQAVSVVSGIDPVAKRAYQVGDSVMILGVVMPKPSELTGYKGEDQPVVFGGYPVKVEDFDGR